MNKRIRITIFWAGALLFGFTGFSCKTTAQSSRPGNTNPDLLEIIYSIADKKGMKVISDINMGGGDLYGKLDPRMIADSMRRYINRYHARYGKHRSLWGWYLNHELNPVKTSDKAQSAFWHQVWKAAADACHQVKPGSQVTISPFFLLDKQSLRGFEYLQPLEYEQWWAAALKAAGIDILMLQDSGAEHLGFFTMEDRRAFFQAFKNACTRAGSQFWLNVETGEVDAKNWQEALDMERAHQRKWIFTPIGRLKHKLNLAAEYGTGIVNWGYFPLMNPIEEAGPWPSGEVDGQPISFAGQQKAYNDYKAYYQQTRASKNAPHIRGTLWMLRKNYEGWSAARLTELVTRQIDAQKAAGFDLLWIINTPQHVAWANQR